MGDPGEAGANHEYVSIDKELYTCITRTWRLDRWTYVGSEDHVLMTRFPLWCGMDPDLPSSMNNSL